MDPQFGSEGLRRLIHARRGGHRERQTFRHTGIVPAGARPSRPIMRLTNADIQERIVGRLRTGRRPCWPIQGCDPGH
jgi:hypothetical protein